MGLSPEKTSLTFGADPDKSMDTGSRSAEGASAPRITGHHKLLIDCPNNLKTFFGCEAFMLLDNLVNQPSV